MDCNGVSLAEKAYPKTVIYGKYMPQYVDLELQMGIYAAMLGISGLRVFRRFAPRRESLAVFPARWCEDRERLFRE